MAVSAFKSTTRRACGIGAENEPESANIVPFQPSTPFNKRSHRRTRSFTDLSSRYISDSTSAAGDDNSKHLDSLFQQGRLFTRYQSDDSESDADSMYSRHTYRSRQLAEIGASRKAALRNGKSKESSRIDIRRSSSNVDGSYKEIADFLSCIDDPCDANEVFPRFSSGGRRIDAQSDSESVFSRLSRPRRSVDMQSDTESVFSRLTRPRRSVDVQSDSESVFSRLTRPRQAAGLGPPRTGATQNGKGKGTRAGALRRSTSQIDLSSPFRSRDDQSETESSYPSHTNQSRQNANFGTASMVAARRKGTRQASLRRSPSQTEISDTSFVGGYRQPSSHHDDSDSPGEVFYGMDLDLTPRDEDASNGHPEEERTIRAVHTQNKEPGAQELDAISLYDAMRVEMRKAVAEIRSELEQKSASKDLVLATPSIAGGLCITVPTEDDDNESTVSAVRREYAVKLEQSEKRAQDLWTQLAAEERRCLDLVKFVKELLPPQPDAGLKPRVPPPQMRPLMGPEVEQQLVSQCLDADAQRYFDECVSISGLDIMSVNDGSSCGVGYQESESPAWSVKDMTFSPRKKTFCRPNEKNVLEPLITFCAQIEQNGRCNVKSSNQFSRVPMNDDGLVLPWLKWETDLDFSFQEQLGLKDGTMIGNLPATSSSSRGKASSRNQSATWWESRHHLKGKQDTQSLDIPAGVSGLGCLGNGDLSSWKNVDFGHLRNVGIRSTGEKGRYDNRFDVEMFVFQRTWLGHGIKDGRILICGGIRL